jgi:hypothetical protein
MAILNVLPHYLAQTECPENAHLVKNKCIVYGTPEHVCLEFAPTLSTLLSRNLSVRSLASLEAYLPSQNVTVPVNVNLGTAVNFTRNFVVTPTGQIFEKMSEETERLIIVIGTILSTFAVAASLYCRASSGR